MVDHNEEFVALFIDWDNLAISVAADLAGATPDVKRIVQAAQNFGTVLIARAYAEWNASSDRLAVYRAGVEPIYAPTFRFEPDPITQAARGKSLADPCMVADCVDILHMLPKITTFVIVSGDKDLIPVVRLAQLRGKHAVVIGPDYAAGVLRDIADEFISYRTVIEAEPRPEGPGEAGRNGRRHIPTRMPQPPQPVQAPRRSRPAAAQAQPTVRQKSREGSQSEQPEIVPAITVPEAIETPKTNGATEPKDTTHDISSIFAIMVDIVRQRTGEGKLRIRATNLKDALIVKVPGFSERKYGFAKFKDFLLAAEKAGAISVSAAGPVHWVSLPAKEEEVAETLPAVGGIETMPEVVPAGPAELSRATDEHYAELVKYVVDLRGRSRWLTYTYVLTNLISYLTKLLSQADAEAAARTVLNRLVQEGVLRIDREPQEVEVGGIKHRVRMCHIVEAHPLVAEALSAYMPEKPAEAEAAGLIDEATDMSEAGELSQLQSMEQAEIAAMQGEPEPGMAHAADYSAAARETEASEAPVSDEGVEAAPEAATSEMAETRPIVGREPSGEISGDMMSSAEAVAAKTSDEAEAELAEAKAAADQMAATAGDGHIPAAEVAALEDALEHGQAQAYEERPRETSPSLVGLSVPLSLEDAFAAVQKIVRESTNAGKPRIRLTGLKAKITGELGHFDEQVYGFKRFKDFLLAAEKAGWVKLENVGQVVWVVPSSRPERGETTKLAAETEKHTAPGTGENAAPSVEPGGKPKRSRRRTQAKTREVLVEG